MGRQRRVLGIIAVVAVAAGSLAACSSSGGGSASASASGTLVIGNIGTYSGDNAADFAGGNTTIQAWAQWTNANGGIDGHRVQVITMDDANSPSAGLEDAKELVQQDHVLAIVGQESGVEPAWSKYVVQQGIPVIGGETVTTDFYTNPDFFPVGSTADKSFANAASYTASKADSANGAFFYCSENPVCADLAVLFKGAFASAGGKLVYSAAVSVSSPNYTGPCLAAKQAGADIISVGAPTTVVLAIPQACAQQGYNPKLMLNLISVTPSVQQRLGNAPTVFSADDLPYNDTSTVSADMRNALKKYAPAVLAPSSMTESVVTVWASGQLFTAAVKGVHGDITSASLKDSLWSMKDQTLGGLTPPLTFVKDKPSSVPCTFVETMTNGTITESLGTKPYCGPSAS
jgi:branched-chain amino acid transport system substrate-binding protein